MEKKLTNSGPLRESADKHSIYTIECEACTRRRLAGKHRGAAGLAGGVAGRGLGPGRAWHLGGICEAGRDQAHRAPALGLNLVGFEQEVRHGQPLLVRDSGGNQDRRRSLHADPPN